MIIKSVYKMNVLSILFCFIYICKCIFNYSLSLRENIQYIFNELNFQIKNANKSTATTFCKQKEMLITIFKYEIIHKKITSKNKLKFVLLKFNLMTIGGAHAYISSIISNFVLLSSVGMTRCFSVSALCDFFVCFTKKSRLPD